MSVTASARFGVVVGFLSAALIAMFFAAWDWLENPGGVFRGEQGTNWSFVWETGVSWFLPMVIPYALIAAALHAWVTRRAHRT